MSYFTFTSMSTLYVCAVLVLADVALGYKYYPELNGWVARQPIVATWSEALHQCSSEGSVLMSPTTGGHLRVMQSLIDGNTLHHVGTRSMLHPRLFVSAEGVSLADMPISDTMKPLQPQVGLCLAMDHIDIYTTSCNTTFPFFCYRKHTSEPNMTECGTFDEGYKLNNVTGSCYKYYNENKVWNDAYWTCVTEGAYLVVVNDEVEARELYNLGKHQTYCILIGIRAWNETKQWMSVHAEPLRDVYHNFANELPSACCTVGCLYPNSNHQLYIMQDTDSRNFVCEKDPNNVRYAMTDQQQLDIYATSVMAQASGSQS